MALFRTTTETERPVPTAKQSIRATRRATQAGQRRLGVVRDAAAPDRPLALPRPRLRRDATRRRLRLDGRALMESDDLGDASEVAMYLAAKRFVWRSRPPTRVRHSPSACLISLAVKAGRFRRGRPRSQGRSAIAPLSPLVARSHSSSRRDSETGHYRGDVELDAWAAGIPLVLRAFDLKTDVFRCRDRREDPCGARLGGTAYPRASSMSCSLWQPAPIAECHP